MARGSRHWDWIQGGALLGVLIALGVGGSALAPAIQPPHSGNAELDGAGWWARLRAITIPQIRPEVYVVALTCTIAALKVFGPIFALTRGGPENATIVPSYFAYTTFFKKLDVGYGAAIATVLTLIIVVVAAVFMFFQSRSERKDG